MKYDLIDIEGVDLRGAKYAVKALTIDDFCPTTTALIEIGPVEAGLIRDGIRLAANVHKDQLGFHKRFSIDRQQRGHFEIANRGGKKGRLFCFHLELEVTTIVCMGSFWKTGRKQDQNKAFDDAAEMMGDYLEWRSQNLQQP